MISKGSEELLLQAIAGCNNMMKRAVEIVRYYSHLTLGQVPESLKTLVAVDL